MTILPLVNDKVKSLLSILVPAAMMILAGCASAPEPSRLPTEILPTPGEAAPTVAAGEPQVQSEASSFAWREDLDFMAGRMLETHPDLFWRVSESELEDSVAELEARIPRLTDEQIIVELARIASLIDGHTHLPLFQAQVNFQLYPLRLYRFSDGLFVVDAAPEHTDLIGSKVTAVGSTPIEEASAAVAPLVPRDNDMTVQLLTPVYLTVPEVLLALGIIDDVQQPGYVFERPDGQIVVADPAPQGSDLYRDWTSLFIDLAGLPGRPEPLSLSRRGDNFWHTVLEDGETLYVQYNQVQSRTAGGLSIDGLAADIESFVEENPAGRVILDIRHNPGGNIRSARPLVDTLSSNEHFDRPGNLFVITGRQTFSAATLFAIEIEQNTEAVFVGEPTGGRPNLFADTVPIRLPNSGISVQVSTIHWTTSDPDDDREWIEPDIPVALSSEDFFGGRDPALGAILDQFDP